MERSHMQNKSRILFYDIETSPLLGYTWGKYEQDVIEFERDFNIMSFAWKWADEKVVHVLALPDFKTYQKDKFDDKELVKELWKLMNEAEIIIGHNSDSFDNKKVNSRFVVHNLLPPTPYKTVDTLKVARKYFKFSSNKLDDLGNTLGLGRKISHTGFKLWKDCLNGDTKAWILMKRYNKQDVVLLEKVYEELKPWINNHPRVAGLFNCPNCGGNLQARGFNYTRSGRKQRYQCTKCAAWTSQGKLEKV